MSRMQKTKWGPLQALRKSNRVEVGDRSMLEIAVNTKKVQNLEVQKKDIKDMEEDSRNYQEMDDLVQRACLVQDGGIYSKNLLHPGSSLPNSDGVTASEKNTEGDFSHFLHSKLKLHGPLNTDDPSSQASPPRSPPRAPTK